MDDGGRCLLDVINDPLLLQSFLECGSENFPKGHHNGDNTLSAAAGSTLLIGHDVVTSSSATSSPTTTLLSLASLKPSLDSMGFNCQADKQSLMGHIAVGTISPAVYPLSANRISPQHLYSIKSPSQGSSPAQSMPPPSPLQSPAPTVLSPNRNSSPTVVLQPQTMLPTKQGQAPYHHASQQPTIIPLSVQQQQQLPGRLSALSGHVAPTTSGVLQLITTPAPVVSRSPQATVRPIQPKQPQQILPKPPKSAQMPKQVTPSPMAANPRTVGVSLNASTNNPVVIGQGQPSVFAGPQGTIVLNQFVPGMGQGPFVIQGNLGNIQAMHLTLRQTQPGHFTTSPAPQQPTVTHGGPQNNATLIAALQAPSPHTQAIIGQPKPASLPGHHTIVFPGGLTGQNINLTSQGSVIHSSHPSQGILTQRPNFFIAPRMLAGNHTLQFQQIQTPQGPITIALAPSQALSLQQLASIQGAQLGGPQLTSVPTGMMATSQGVFSNVALRHQPSPVPVPSISPFAPAKQIQEQQQQQVTLQRTPTKVEVPSVAPTLVVNEGVSEQCSRNVVMEEKKSLSDMMKPSLNLAELLKEHGIVPESTPPPSPTSSQFTSSDPSVDAEVAEATSSVRDLSQQEGHITQSQAGEAVVSTSSDHHLHSAPAIQQPTVSSSVQEHPALLSRLNTAPAVVPGLPDVTSLVLGSADSVRSISPEIPQQHLIPLTIRNNSIQPHILNLSSAGLTVTTDSSVIPVSTTFVTSGSQVNSTSHGRFNHVIVGLQPVCTTEQSVQQQQQQFHCSSEQHQAYGSNVPTANTSKLVPAALLSSNPVLVKTSDALQGYPLPHSSAAASISSTSDFQSQEVAKHQQTLPLLVQLRQAPPNNQQFNPARTITLPAALQAVDKGSDNCKLNQEIINKTRQASSNFISVVNRPPVLHHLVGDQNRVLRPDTSTPFTSCQDACTKLLRYHVYNSQVPSEDDLRKTDELFEVVSQRLQERRQRMLNKYRYLLLKESMKPSPSSENVMLERMFIQDEIPSLKMYKKMVSEGKDMELPPPNTFTKDPVALPEGNEYREAVALPPPATTSPPRQCECRNQQPSLKRDRTRSPCSDSSAEPSSKKCIKPSSIKAESAAPLEMASSVYGSVVHEQDDDIVSEIRKELNISPIDHRSDEEEGPTDFEAHSGNLDFFEPPVTRSNSSCGSPFHYNAKSSSSSLRCDFDVMDGNSEWSEAYGDQKLFMDAEVDHLLSDHGKLDPESNARTFSNSIRMAKSNSVKLNCIHGLDEANGEYLGSLDEDSDDGDELNVQVQTAIKSILDFQSAENHSYYADGELVSSVFSATERRSKGLQDTNRAAAVVADFDESLNPDLSGNSLESDAALDEAVRSILL